MFCHFELCRALDPQDCHKGTPSPRLRGLEKEGSAVTFFFFKWGVSAVLTAWSDAGGRGKGLFPPSVPSGTLLTTNKINKSASSTQEQSVCVGDLPDSKTCSKNKILFSLFHDSHHLSSQCCTSFFYAWPHIAFLWNYEGAEFSQL